MWLGDRQFSDRTLKRAKKTLGVTATKEGFGSKGKWFWELPFPHRGPTNPIEGQESPIENLAPYEESGPLKVLVNLLHRILECRGANLAGCVLFQNIFVIVQGFEDGLQISLGFLCAFFPLDN